MEKLLTVGEVSYRTRLSVTSVRNLANRGVLPVAARLGSGGDRLFRVDDVDAMLKERARNVKPRRVAAAG